jgi:hypothetical protein
MTTMRLLIEGLAGVLSEGCKPKASATKKPHKAAKKAPKGKAKTEARTPGGRPLSEQLGAYLVEYRTKGWSTVPDKSGKVYKTTPPGKKGVWRTLNGRHVFFPQDGSGPIGGAPGRAGWTKRTGKYHEAGQKPAQKTAKTTKRGAR